MIHSTRPEGFDPKFTCVACLLEHEGEIVLLHRQGHKNEGNTWGLPAGKVEDGESIEEAITREIFQETGFEVSVSPNLFTSMDVSYPGYDFVYHLFHLPLDERPDVKISKEEHKDYKWITPKEALSMELIGDLRECLKRYYKDLS